MVIYHISKCVLAQMETQMGIWKFFNESKGAEVLSYDTSEMGWLFCGEGGRADSPE